MRTLYFRQYLACLRSNYLMLLSCSLGILLLSGCEKSDLSGPDYTAAAPSEQDLSGGTWKTILIKSGNEVTVPSPLAPTDPTYQQELSEVKSLQAQLSKTNRSAITYWASGATLRWNEIARQLVAKYNVAPVVGAAPDPSVPFANPVLAARIYALLSVAQYDALVSAWHYKLQFGRPAPSRTDPGIKLLIPASGLSSYPSEDAVIAATSLEILKFIFPKETDYLTQQATQHQESRLWAGANVRSDLAAGESLGKNVAKKVLEYAREDRMNLARDANNTWQQVVVPVKWQSLEIPVRGPMLPLGGKVKTWFDSTALAAGLPGPPPVVGSARFNQDLIEVRKIADTRTREQWRISDFWADGAGTPTPPGHWNQIAEGLIREKGYSEIRTARTLALLNRALMDAAICCWLTKYTYYVPRPSQMDPEIKTATGIPNFPSYTSGHATFSGAAATILGYMFPENSTDLNRQAAEAAISRMYGGIHYRFDNEAGLACGQNIGKVAILWGKGDGSPK
ncbi:MAG: phosphatase family protein [Adhaeribacter sp.]|nr:phosphatase family protein [Adhaeribacter sp.]